MTSEEKAFEGIFSEDCDIMNGNIFIAGKHSIRPNEYEKMIKAFFGYLPDLDDMEERNYTAANFTSSCVTHCVRFDFDSFANTNNDINVSIAEHPTEPSPPGTLVTGKYSLHLFRGLHALYQPDAYYFCKARTTFDGEIVTTLALAVVADNVIVYYGDLTNMYP